VEDDFNRVIEIKEREKCAPGHDGRVHELL